MRRIGLVLLAFAPLLSAQTPSVPIFGPAGASGSGFAFVNSPAVVFSSDATHTMVYPEMSGSSGVLKVTSTVSLTAQRDLVAPLVKGFTWQVINDTNGGQGIRVIGSSGTGVVIANGAMATVATDGVNYFTPPAGSGGISGSGTANSIPKFTGTTAVGNSSCSDDGTTFACTVPTSAPTVIAGTPSSAAKAAIPSGAHGIAGDESSTVGVPAAGVDYFRWDSTSHCIEFSTNGSSEVCLSTGGGTLPSQSVTFNTSAGTFTAACQSGYTCTSLGGVAVINGTWLNSDGASINWSTSVPAASQFCQASQTWIGSAGTNYNISSQPNGTTQFEFNFKVAASSTSTLYVQYACTPK